MFLVEHASLFLFKKGFINLAPKPFNKIRSKKKFEEEVVGDTVPTTLTITTFSIATLSLMTVNLTSISITIY
jgi:hypothetical protein